MQVNVNTVTDFTFGFLAHNMAAPPAIPAPVPTPSVEMVAPFLWIYGFAMNQNKFSNGAKPVTCKGTWVVLDGHECGMLIPDITIPPAPNVLVPLYWLFSSRKPIMAASTVKMNGTPVACAQLLGLPPIPMMTCGDPVGAPTTLSPINLLNRCAVGITWLDILVAVINVAASMAIDYIASDRTRVGDRIAKELERRIASEFLRNVVTNNAKGLLTSMVGFATSGITGNATFSASIGMPFLGAGISITPHPDPGGSVISGSGSVPFVRGDTAAGVQVAGSPVAPTAPGPT